MDLILCLIFAASGAAALIFEALWFRQASLVLGNSVWATGLTTSAFMAGLAAGNAVCARYGHRVRRPLEMYALLEGAVAVLGLAVVVGLPVLSPALAGIARPLLDHPAALNAVRLAAAFLILSAPAAAMGATLPLLVEILGGTEAGFGRALGRLYAFNTLGAVGGVLVGEMFLVPRLGIRGTALVAASLDVAAALAVLSLRRRLAFPARSGDTGPFGRLWPAGARHTLVAAGLAGATLLALEAVWFRFLLLFVCGTAVAFASMLAVVLAGIAAGAFLTSRWLARTPGAVRHAPAIALAAGLAVVLGYVPFPLDGPRDASCGLQVVPLAAAVAFPVAALSGALFTLLGAMVRPKVSSAVAATGAITLANTVGALLGGFAGAFLLLPALGIERSVFAGALAYLAVAALAARALGRETAVPSTIASAAALAVLLALFPFGRMERRILPRVHGRWTSAGSEVVALREGLTETSVWLTDRAWGQPVAHRLVTNGFSMAATGYNVDRYTRLFVYWPIALRPQARRALLISYGVGSTAAALVGTRTLEAIDVVDISRDVLELNRAALPRSGHPLADPRVRVHVEDGRQHLLVRDGAYDLITAEPPPPRNAGIVSLYTREFFELVRRRLVDGGIATYWLPVHSLQPAEARSVLGAFCSVFPDCTLWSGYGLDWMMAGTKDLLAAPTAEEFTAQWRDEPRRAELTRLGFDRPETLGTTFLGDAEDLRAYAQGYPLLTDDRPGILGPRDPAGFAPEFLAVMEAGAARDRFRRSAWVRRLWPGALQESTAAAFEEQDLVNRLSTVGAAALRFEEIAAWTVGAARRFHVLWLAGINDDVAEAAARAEGAGVDEPRVHQALGAVALAEGRPAEAAARFDRALAATQGPTRVVFWRALAQCRAGQPEQAARGLKDAAARVPPEDASSVPVIASCRFRG